MAARSTNEPLRSVLNHVEEELNGDLKKVCGIDDVGDESTVEMERLGETLSKAAREARAAAALRRRMKRESVQSRLNEQLSEKRTG
jgi:hypothetical protein